MSLFSKLFGGGGSKAAAVEPTEYKGFAIYPEPTPEGGRFRVGARIEKTIGEETKTHTLVRADVIDGKDQADTISINKAKQVIDEQGERLFG